MFLYCCEIVTTFFIDYAAYCQILVSHILFNYYSRETITSTPYFPYDPQYLYGN